ncbi:MAG: peptidase [Candidatus Chloroheliales bacterium]|nr:MAG: peptidase [Chloroflexota bacterium]
MAEPQVAPYGAWASPITTDLITAGRVALELPMVDGGDIYWLEGRATNQGRVTLVRRTNEGQVDDITGTDFNVRTRVHEYGGGAYTVADGIAYCSNFDDNRVYHIPVKNVAAQGEQRFAPTDSKPDAAPQPLTSDSALRYADLLLDRQRGRLICVREDHRDESHEAINTIVSLPLTSEGEGQVLLSGNDFYSSPRLSPDGARFAWLTWNHPNMPWDGNELWVGEVAADGSIANPRLVAGGESESIFQPEWSPDGNLYFVSDRSGWWNIYRRTNRGDKPVAVMAAEFGKPQWVFGMATYGFASATEIICVVSQNGSDQLMRLDTRNGQLAAIALPYTSISSPVVAGGRVLFIGAGPQRAAELVSLDLASGQLEILRHSSTVKVDPGYLSVPQPIEFPTENGLTAHALFYPPYNRDYTAPAGELPPLVVRSHGGPTSAASSAFNLNIQYFTSRGLAVLDVNYGGSAGYGREYRQRLEGQWGVVDVDDCVNGARYLVEHGLADGNRLAITGGSAGGYTTLCAVTFRDTFKAGASLFGIGDLETFVHDTHKFESRYLERLVGPYPAQRDIYRQRSAINYPERISCPLIIFQGLDDKVVPPNQAETMVAALKAKGLPYAYVAYEGEGHGFRRAANIKHALESELYFYSRVLGFPLADPIEPVKIEGLGDN